VTDAKIDQAALAALRPGMAVSELEKICGPSWPGVKPGADGWVVGLSDLGFLARIDVSGMIGKIGYSGRFPSTLSVDQLSIGMSVDHAIAAYPTMRHVEDVSISGMMLRRFLARRPDGLEVEIRARDGRVIAFDISQPGSTYSNT
jgi:hypothetical protein